MCQYRPLPWRHVTRIQGVQDLGHGHVDTDRQTVYSESVWSPAITTITTTTIASSSSSVTGHIQGSVDIPTHHTYRQSHENKAVCQSVSQSIYPYVPPYLLDGGVTDGVHLQAIPQCPRLPHHVPQYVIRVYQ